MTEKKISISYENDEVVSIEVDGVQYSRPEDIPDEEDREKVEFLLSRSPDDEADEPFDSADFERQFKEIQRQNARFPTLIFAIFLTVAVILLGVTALLAFNAFRQVTQEQSAPGRVVDLVERSSYDSQQRTYQTYSYPVVEFSLPGGAPQRVQLNEGSWPPAYQRGDNVTILYLPGRPEDARIKSFSSTVLLWLAPVLTGILGTVFLVLTLVVLRVHRSQQAELAQQAEPGAA